MRDRTELATAWREIGAMTCPDLRAVLKDLGEADKGPKDVLCRRLWRRRYPGERVPAAADDGNGEATLSPAAERAALLTALAQKRCGNCGTMGLWRVYSKHDSVRYVRCGGCGYCDKAAV